MASSNGGYVAATQRLAPTAVPLGGTWPLAARCGAGLRVTLRGRMRKERLMNKILITLAGVGLLGLGACTATGNTERSAVGGAAIGAIAGAVIGNNVGSGSAGTGAAIGAAIGGTAGGVHGCQQDGGCGAAPNHRQYYDERAGRYYYRDSQDGRYYWEDGSPRG